MKLSKSTSDQKRIVHASMYYNVVQASYKNLLDDDKILQKHQKVLTNFFIYVYTSIIIITKTTKKVRMSLHW